MQVIPYDTLAATFWANGGGITREIAAERDAEGILWRISLADVNTEGSFSHFAGLQRILTVIEGPGMVLETCASPLNAAPLEPVSFAGDLNVIGRVPSGPVRNLNVVFRSSRIEATVAALTGCATITPGANADIVFIVLGGAWISGRLLLPLTTVINADMAVRLGPDAQVIHIMLERKTA